MIRLNKLRKTFGRTVAVDDLTLEIGRGEVFGLLGPNGAGKSTTINMVFGQIAPDAGTVELEGLGDPARPEARRGLGVAPQSLALYDDLSGEENLAFLGRLHGLRGTRLKRAVGAALESVGLTDRRRDRAKAYSGGMKRRLNLAGAILHDPPIVLLDEPTAGVDPQSRNNILEMVRGLASRGKTVVYTTHYMEEAQKLCDRVGIIDHGRILALGTVADLLHAHGGQSEVTIRRGDGGGAEEQRVRTDDPLAEIRRALASADVSGVRIDRPDLETVFLSLTGRRLRD